MSDKSKESFQSDVPELNAILPTEDKDAYLDFFINVICNLDPEGEIQTGYAADIAALLWRKNHLSIFRTERLERARNAKILKASSLEGAVLARLDDAVEDMLRAVEEAAADVSIDAEKKTEIERKAADRQARVDALTTRLLRRSGKAQPYCTSEIGKTAGSADSEHRGAAQPTGQRGGSIADRLSEMEKNRRNLILACKDAFGAHDCVALIEQSEKVGRDGGALDLAWFGDDVTIAAYREQLKVIREIDEAVASKIELLFELKKESRRRKTKTSASIMPPYR